MVSEEDVAGHAGKNAQWKGKIPVNEFSIGIEIVNATGAFPAEQMDAVAQLVKKLMTGFRIDRHRVLAHCEVSPLVESTTSRGAKRLVNEKIGCPGRAFDWPLLEGMRQAAVPLEKVPPEKPYDAFFAGSPGDALCEGNSDLNTTYGRKNHKNTFHRGLIRRIQSDLQSIGYEAIPTTSLESGEYTPRMAHIVQRFQARYFSGSRTHRPPMGSIDQETANAIRGVLLDMGRP